MTPREPGAPALDPAELARHARFVRGLARALTHDAEGADELTARSLHAVVERPPPAGSNVAAWLTVVMRRLVGRARRDDERRVRRERGAAIPEAQPAPDETAAKVEWAAELAAAFARLRDPERATLFRRWFEEETLAAIADADGVPLATVKSRLARGLERLRAELVRGRGRRDVVRGLALLAAPPAGALPLAATAAIAVSTGSVVMSGKGKLAVAAAVVLAALGGRFAALRATRRADPEPSPITSRPAPAESAPAIDVVVAPAGGDVERAEQRAPSAAPFTSGRVVDLDGHPLSDVAVVAGELDRGEPELELQLPLDLRDAERRPLARTDGDGRFLVPAPSADLVSLHFLRAGYVAAELRDLPEAAAARQALTVVLQPARTLTVRVVGSDGAPARAALVQVEPLGEEGAPEPGWESAVAALLADRPRYSRRAGACAQFTLVDRDGVARFDSLPAGRLRLLAATDGGTFTRRDLDATADACQLVVARWGLAVDVVANGSGEPLTAASVLLLDGLDGRVVATIGPNRPERSGPPYPAMLIPGRITLHPSLPGFARQPDGRMGVELLVIAPGHRPERLSPRWSGEEPPELTVELEPGAAESELVGRVDPPLAATLALYPIDCGTTGIGEAPLATATSATDGTFELGGVTAGRWLLIANAPGRATLQQSVSLPGADVVLRLESEARLEVVVRDDAGDPVVGALCQLQAADQRRAWRARSAADGVARFSALPAGDLLLAVLPRVRVARGEVGARCLHDTVFDSDSLVRLAAGETTTVERVVLTRRRLDLAVRDEAGRAVVDASVRVRLQSGPAVECESLAYFGNGSKIDLDAEGRGAVELYPGTWTVSVERNGIAREEQIDLRRDRGAELLFQLPTLATTARLAGRVTDRATGTPIVGATLRAGWGSGEQAEQRTDAAGRYEFVALPIGAIALVVAPDPFELRRKRAPSSTASAAPEYGRGRAVVALADGDSRTLDFALPRLGPPPDGAPCVEVDLVLREASTGRHLAGGEIAIRIVTADGQRLDAGELTADADGRVTGSIAAADRYELDVSGPPPSAAPWLSDHAPRHLELAPTAGRLEGEVRLERGVTGR